MLTYADDIIDFGKMQMRHFIHVHMHFDITHENKYFYLVSIHQTYCRMIVSMSWLFMLNYAYDSLTFGKMQMRIFFMFICIFI